MPVETLKKRIFGTYISSFFSVELRRVFTEKERKNFLSRQSPYRYYPQCSNSDNVTCFKVLNRVIFLPEKYETTTFKTKNILDGLKPDHFFSGERFNQQDSGLDMDAKSFALAELDESRSPTKQPVKRKPVYESEQVMIDRERHICPMARKRLSTRERRKDLAEKFRAADSYAKEVVNRWLRTNRVDRDAVIESGASAARRLTQDIMEVEAQGFSFDEDDKSITQILDSLADRPFQTPNPSEYSPLTFKKDEKEKSPQKLIVESELDEFEKFMKGAQERDKEDNVRKIEMEMDTYGDRDIFETLIEGQNEDNMWMTMSNQNLNKFNILNMLNRKKPETPHN